MCTRVSLESSEVYGVSSITWWLWGTGGAACTNVFTCLAVLVWDALCLQGFKSVGHMCAHAHMHTCTCIGDCGSNLTQKWLGRTVPSSPSLGQSPPPWAVLFSIQPHTGGDPGPG